MVNFKMERMDVKLKLLYFVWYAVKMNHTLYQGNIDVSQMTVEDDYEKMSMGGGGGI